MATTNEPRIILIPLSRSHPFNQRDCSVTEPQKVGRPVDKKRISPNNLIFDCRVLSRNHALIWFEDGKFYIQDTKSSNGTFVNDSRLSPSGEESTPRELTTRDVVQFGVNVNVDKRVTHGCIIATIKLFINGKELPGPDPDIQEVVQVVQNCLNKEQEFEAKLMSMQEALTAAHALAKESMINIVKEDELLSRLEMLENQLHVYTRNASEDDLKKQLTIALEEKHTDTIVSKEKVQLILQEKIDCSTRLSRVQRDNDKAEEECQKYRTLYEALKQEHSQQMSKLTEQIKVIEKQKNELQEKAKEQIELSIVSQDSVKNELERMESQLLESQDKLSQANNELEVARQQGYLSTINNSDNLVENTVVNKFHDDEESETRTGLKHGNVDGMVENGTFSLGAVNSVVEESVLMTILPALGNQMDGTGSEGQGKQLEKELQNSRKRMDELLGEVSDLGAIKKDLSIQLQELKDQLLSERNDKVTLLQNMDTLSKQLSDLRSNRPELYIYQEGDNGGDTSLEGQLKARTIELVAVIEEKESLLSRLTKLENDKCRVQKESKSSLSEMTLKLAETKEESILLKKRLVALQDSLTEARNNSTSPTTTTTTIGTSIPALDPLLENCADPRIKVLSTITLASIAVALLSVIIAYFF